MYFQHLTTPRGDRRYYKNINTCFVTLPIFGASDVEGIITTSMVLLELSAEIAALTSSPVTTLSLRGPITAWMLWLKFHKGFIWNQNSLLFKWGRQVIKFLSQRDRLISQWLFHCCRCTVSWNNPPRRWCGSIHDPPCKSNGQACRRFQVFLVGVLLKSCCACGTLVCSHSPALDTLSLSAYSHTIHKNKTRQQGTCFLCIFVPLGINSFQEFNFLQNSASKQWSLMRIRPRWWIQLKEWNRKDEIVIFTCSIVISKVICVATE